MRAKQLTETIVVLRDMNSDRVSVQVTDDASHCVALEVTIAASVFADALFHRTVPCTFLLNESGVVGAEAQTKRELVPFGSRKMRKREDIDTDNYRTPEAIAALAPFEVEGWHGEARDLYNRHNLKVGKGNNQEAFEVVFRRYVRDGEPLPISRGVRRG